MPWTPSDAQRHTHKATTPALQELWAKVANEALQRLGDEGQAIREANAVVARQGDKLGVLSDLSAEARWREGGAKPTRTAVVDLKRVGSPLARLAHPTLDVYLHGHAFLSASVANSMKPSFSNCGLA
jgi:hypothetical protein